VIIEPGVCQDQSRQINDLPGGRGFGEGQRAASELVVQIARDGARLGIKPGRATMPALYRCRPAGEEYWSIRVVRGTGRAETPWLAVQQAACGAITKT